MGLALESLPEAGHAITDEDMARLSPLVHDQINRLGISDPSEAPRTALAPGLGAVRLLRHNQAQVAVPQFTSSLSRVLFQMVPEPHHPRAHRSQKYHDAGRVRDHSEDEYGVLSLGRVGGSPGLGRTPPAGARDRRSGG